MMGYKKVTVNVTDVEETETITLSAQQGQVGVALTATYNDADRRKARLPPISRGSGSWADHRFLVLVTGIPAPTSAYIPANSWHSSGRGQLHQV